MKTSFNENLDKYPPSISCGQNIEPLIKYNKSRMPSNLTKRRYFVLHDKKFDLYYNMAKTDLKFVN